MSSGTSRLLCDHCADKVDVPLTQGKPLVAGGLESACQQRDDEPSHGGIARVKKQAVLTA